MIFGEVIDRLRKRLWWRRQAMGLFDRTCRVCGCTEDNCQQCAFRTGEPCRWIAVDLCSACEMVELERAVLRTARKWHRVHVRHGLRSPEAFDDSDKLNRAERRLFAALARLSDAIGTKASGLPADQKRPREDRS